MSIDPEVTWWFNEAVSLLREARQYLPLAGHALAQEIDESLPRIQAALVLAATDHSEVE